jgi:hypothetical protein
MKTIIISILLSNLFFLSVSVSATELTADVIMTEITTIGSKAVIDKLWNSEETHPNDWDRLIDKIETGEKKWLVVAKSLKPASDAGSSEDLNGAMSLALLKNPLDVLTMIQSGPFNISDVCTCPYAAETSAEENVAYTYLFNAEKTLIDLIPPQDNPHLDTVRNNCLDIIQGIKSGYYKSSPPDSHLACENRIQLDYDVEFQSLLRNIETGTDEALAELKNMYPIRDQLKSSYLKRAMARALPNNPCGVLSMVENGYIGMKEACGTPYEEKNKLLQHLRESLQVLRKQIVSSEDSLRSGILGNCLKEIQSSIQSIEKH